MAPTLSTAHLPSGLVLPYPEQGDPGGIPVVLLHAYVDSWRSFGLVLPHLPPSFRVLAPSQRGHGDASRPADGYALDDYVADVGAFLDAVGLDSAVLVGASSGGLVAQRFASAHTDRVQALALVGAPRTLDDKPALADFARRLDACDDPLDPGFVREFVQSTFHRPVPPDFLEVMIGESLKVPARVWRAALAGLMQAGAPTETGTIAAPTLIVWGDRDAFLTRSEQEAMAAAIPRSELKVYEGTGHLVLWEQPARVAADVRRLVESATATAGGGTGSITRRRTGGSDRGRR